MEKPTRHSVIIVGAGISGIAAAKSLAENGVEDLLILEATDRIGGRIRKEDFGGITAEIGAGWIAGVGGQESNPIWDMACEVNLRTCFSDYSDARFNIYDQRGKIFPRDVAEHSYQKAVDSAIKKLLNKESHVETPSAPMTPIELAIDFILHDFEMAEVEPIPTYVDFGESEYLIADERGYDHLLYKMAESFLFTSSEGLILDARLKLNTVVGAIQSSRNGVSVKTEDGSVYEANYVILSVSVGVLQSQLITFSPPLPRWKVDAISNCEIMVYTKIFLKFPYKFWPCGPGKEFFIYAHERRGYYTFWQHMENAYPGSNILVVTLTNEESKRVETQSDQQTMREAMDVLRNMFGQDIPEASDILVPLWWNNKFQRGSYSNYPIFDDQRLVDHIKAPVGRVFFTGEHTSEKFNGFVHGGYLSGIDTAKTLLDKMKEERERKDENQTLLASNGSSLTASKSEKVSNRRNKFDIPRHLLLHRNELAFSGAIL